MSFLAKGQTECAFFSDEAVGYISPFHYSIKVSTTNAGKEFFWSSYYFHSASQTAQKEKTIIRIINSSKLNT